MIETGGQRGKHIGHFLYKFKGQHQRVWPVVCGGQRVV